jgi:hypothetical protein
MSIYIANDVGEVLGFIAEEPRGLLASLSRQLLRTHRPFRAVIMDREGTPILWVWCACIVSAMSAHSCAPDPEAIRLDKFSHVRPEAQELA